MIKDESFMTDTFPTEETIAAIATAIAAGQGGIAVIRISGKASIEVAKSVVEIPGKYQWESHTVLYGLIKDEETKSFIDEVLVVIMKAPRSFTGEDIVEIHCHGGLIAVQRVLEKVLNHKQIRRAQPGEFSQRAFLNGRLDLTQAEAISELIGARSVKAAELAMNGIDGGIQRRINELRENLLEQLCELEARVDFEDELPPLNGNDVLQAIEKVRLALEVLITDAKKGAFYRQGLKVALIGCPNVGKSSLLNRLSRKDRSIVTDLPGTTRDLIESEVVLNGVPITLVDTAGIRSTKNRVEQLGIRKSEEALSQSDIVLMIFDLSIGWSHEDEELHKKIPPNTPHLIIGNKSDLKEARSAAKRPKLSIDSLEFSALTGAGEKELINSILEICGANLNQSVELALNERQSDLAALAVASLKRTKETASQDLPWDFWTIDLREAIRNLGEITGEDVTESLLDRIFQRFCIGK